MYILNNVIILLSYHTIYIVVYVHVNTILFHVPFNEQVNSKIHIHGFIQYGMNSIN